MQKIVLAQHCDGLPKLEDFRLETDETPEPEQGQMLVRHIYNSVDSGGRSRMSGNDKLVLPVGSTVGCFSAGVVEKSLNPAYPEGTKVFCAGGWSTHSIQDGTGFFGVIPDIPNVPLSLWVGILSISGITAWCGLKFTASFKPGDRVLVTSAAGPVGATAGQLAKAWGAEKVVGIAGSEEKCAWMFDEAGFDGVINYKDTDDLDAAISGAFPKGIDVLFDNVGNAMVDMVLPKMRRNGRVCVSGQVADYNLAYEEVPGIFNTKPIILSRLRIQGLVAFDFAPEYPAALQSMAALISSGQLKYKEERFEGLDSTAEAFVGLFTGESFGRRVVQVSEEP